MKKRYDFPIRNRTVFSAFPHDFAPKNSKFFACCMFPALSIIPLRERTGNHNCVRRDVLGCSIIPLRERTGNHQNTPSKKDMLGSQRIGSNPLQDGWGCAIMDTLERCQLGEWGLPRSFFYESSLVLSPTGGAGRFSDRFSSRAAGRREVFIVCLKSRI